MDTAAATVDTWTIGVYGAIFGLFFAIAVGSLWEWWRDRNPK